MNWEVIGTAAELIAAFGVITTLFYLAFQIKMNTDVLKAEASKEVYSGWSEWILQVSEHQHLILFDQLVKPDAQWSDFSVEQQASLGLLLRSFLLRFESEYSLYKANILDANVWEKHRAYCKSFVSSPAIATWWKAEMNQPIYSDAFLEHISNTPNQGHVNIGTLSENESMRNDT